MKTYITLLLAAMFFGVTVGQAFATEQNDHTNQGKRPRGCPEAPGAFVSSQAKERAGSATAPGQDQGNAQASKGQGAGKAEEALAKNCSIGALPQEDE